MFSKRRVFYKVCLKQYLITKLDFHNTYIQIFAKRMSGTVNVSPIIAFISTLTQFRYSCFFKNTDMPNFNNRFLMNDLICNDKNNIKINTPAK